MLSLLFGSPAEVLELDSQQNLPCSLAFILEFDWDCINCFLYMSLELLD